MGNKPDTMRASDCLVMPMATQNHNPASPIGASPEQFQEALARLLRSHTLKSRARLREFLEFVGRLALEGHGAEIKEQAIGVAVFGRPQDYNVQEDTIVRVTARQLRQKIEEYYASEGANDPWMIEIPKGSYVPFCCQRDDRRFGAAPGLAAAIPASPFWRNREALGWGCAALLACLCVFLWLRAPSHGAVPEQPTLLGLVLSPAGERVTVVSGDGVVQVFKDLTGDAPTVADYETRGYLESKALQKVIGEANPVWKNLRDRHLMATGSLHVLVRLVQAVPSARITVRHPREIAIRDLMDGNAILLSGPFANPWVQLFEEKLNFRIDQDRQASVFIRNVSPTEGELAEYRPNRGGGKRTTFARLAYMPNLSGNGKVLLIGGPSSALMELMSSAVSEPAFLKDLAATLGADEATELPFCEILMEVEEMADVLIQSRIVAIRKVEPGEAMSRLRAPSPEVKLP